MEIEPIQNKIYEIRGYRVMLDRDLALMYGVETRALNQAVKRNIDRFPQDFMFQLTKEEFNNWKSQIVISNSERMSLRQCPYAFTELGVSMLSSVLKSVAAIQINIKIMRAFVLVRQYALTYADLKRELDRFMQSTDVRFNEVYQALTELASPKKLPALPRHGIGFFTKEQREKGEDLIE